MNLTEGFVKNEIIIDLEADVHFGSRQAFLERPVSFPTVTFTLMATNGLSQISDRIRKERGFAPMHPMDEYTDETCDNDGWYDYYTGINGFSDSRMDTCIEFLWPIRIPRIMGNFIPST